MTTNNQQLRQIKRRLDSRKPFLFETPGESQDEILNEFYNWAMGRRRQ